jgi:hypothetical protein
MTDCLAALTKRVAELCQAGLEACHCVEECPRMVDPPPRSSEDTGIQMFANGRSLP